MDEISECHLVSLEIVRGPNTWHLWLGRGNLPGYFVELRVLDHHCVNDTKKRLVGSLDAGLDI